MAPCPSSDWNGVKTDTDIFGQLMSALAAVDEALGRGQQFYVMVRPDEMGGSVRLLVQEVLEQGAVILRPAEPGEVPGLRAEIEAALANLPVENGLCLVYAPVAVHSHDPSDGREWVQTVKDRQIALQLVVPQLGDVLHNSQVFPLDSHRLGNLMRSAGDRLPHTDYGDAVHSADGGGGTEGGNGSGVRSGC